MEVIKNVIKNHLGYYLDNNNLYKQCYYTYKICNISGNNHQCNTNLSCPNDYPILIEDKMECIKYNIENIKKELLLYEKKKWKFDKKRRNKLL